MSTSYGGGLFVCDSETRLGMEDEGAGFMWQ